jgi:hypothetical protein
VFNDEVVAESRLSTPKRDSIVRQYVLADREGCELLVECTSPAVISAQQMEGASPGVNQHACNDAWMPHADPLAGLLVCGMPDLALSRRHPRNASCSWQPPLVLDRTVLG